MMARSQRVEDEVRDWSGLVVAMLHARERGGSGGDDAGKRKGVNNDSGEMREVSSKVEIVGPARV